MLHAKATEVLDMDFKIVDIDPGMIWRMCYVKALQQVQCWPQANLVTL